MFFDDILKAIVIAILVLLALPLFACIAALYYAGMFLWSCGRAFASGFGVGKEPNPATVTRPSKKGTGDREPAYDHYLFGQAWRDARHVGLLGARSLRTTGISGWKQIHTNYFEPSKTDPTKSREWTLPVGISLVAGFGMAILLAGLVLMLVAVGATLALGLLLGSSFCALYLLRGLDTAILRIRGATKTCKHCGRRVAYPEYSCPGCDVRHHNLRPGRYGITHRICACGRRFPSLTILKSYALKGWCSHCHKELAERIGMTAEIVIPVFGAPSAGKTQLITVLIIAVETLTSRGGGTFDYADENTRNRTKDARRVLTTTNDTQKTAASATTIQPAFSIRVTPKKGTAKLLHVFDAAGETFASTAKIHELEYLKIAHVFVFVIDPLSIKQLWQIIDERMQKSPSGQKRARKEPRIVFTDTVQAAAEMGIDTARIRLAVVVSKADLIKDVLREAAVDDDRSIRTWLMDSLEQGPMIRAMDHNFKNVSFFLTSALTDNHHEADPSIEKFVEKTLTAEGLRL